MLDSKTTSRKIIRVPELANLLREMIEKEQIPNGAPIDSTRKLADRYGVSPVTANRAINELVDQKVLYRVPGKGTFIYRNRSWRNTGARIGFYPYQGYKQHTKDFYLGIGLFYQTLGNMLKKNGYNVSMISNIEKEDLDILQKTIESTDALMLNKDFLNNRNISLLCSYSRPLILVDGYTVLDFPFHQVIPDPFNGYRKAVDHLASLGVKKILIAGVTNTETHRARRASLHHIIQMFHPEISFADFTQDHIYADFGQECGRILGRKYLQMADRPAIFSVCDYISFGMLEVLTEAGLKPGRDFKLVSYDNLEGNGICPFGEPVLTTVQYPYRKIEEELMKLLEDVLTSPEGHVKIIKVPAEELIIRSTT